MTSGDEQRRLDPPRSQRLRRHDPEHGRRVDLGPGEGFKAALADASKRPAGEKTEKVAGHHYEKIVAGPDKGHYLNRTGNPRDGEDFQIVQRGGRTFHVYGTGTTTRSTSFRTTPRR